MHRSVRSFLITLLAVLFAGIVLPASDAWATPRDSIVYTDGSGKIYRINPDGTDQLELLGQMSTKPSRTIPMPDGYSVVSYTDRLILLAPDGSSVADISDPNFLYTAGYAISPDGSRIAFTGRPDTQTNNEIYLMNTDGSGSPMLLTSDNGMVLDWGGPGVLYRARYGSTFSVPLWRIDPFTGTKVVLTPTNFNVIDAKYSPDDSRIVLVGQYSGVSGGNRLWVMNADGTGLTEVVTSPDTLVPNSVDWASDGSLRVAVTAYPLGHTGDYALYQVDVTSGATTMVAPNGATGSMKYVFWGMLEDPLTPTTTTPDDVAGQYSDEVLLTATLMADTTPLSGKDVVFRVDSVDVGTATTDASGVVALPYIITLPAGTYTVEAEFLGDSEYAGSLGISTLTVSRENATLTYTGDTAATGGSLTLSALLTEEADGFPGDRTNAGMVEFVLKRVSDGSTVGTYTAAVQTDGSASVTTGVLPNEPYTVDVTLLANDYYNALPTSAVIRASTSITVDDASAQYSDVVTLRATLTPAVSGKIIAFEVGGTSVGTATTDASGVATLSYKIAKAAGSPQIQASFVGDTYYTASTGSGTLFVSQEDATLAYTGDTEADGGAFTLQALLTEVADGSTGNITLAGTVQFDLYYRIDGTLAGSYTAAVQSDGTATVNLSSLAARSYDLVVTLLPNGYYTAAPVNEVIQTAPVLTVDNVTGQYSDTVILRATLTADGGPVRGETITFTVDGVAVGSALTDASGVASLSYDIQLTAGTYTIEATFAGNASYTGAIGTGTLTVAHENATLIYTGDTLTSGGSLTLSATLTEEADPTPGDITNVGTVEFVVQKLDGTVLGTYTAAVQADGTASTTTPSLPNEPYDITVRLQPNGYYTAPDATGHVQATTTLMLDAASGQYSDAVTFTATMSPAASGKTITFTVDGVVAGTATTDASGVASLPYLVELGAGSHVITASFAGDADYTTDSDSNTLTVTQEDATLTYTGDTSLSSSGGSLSLSATVTQDADGSPGDITLAGTVRFTVKKVSDGTVVETVDAAVDATGVASGATSVLPAEPYTIDVELLPGSYYAAPALTPAATVKVEPVLVVDAKAGQYSDAVTLTATLSDAAGGVGGKDITFTVDGVVVGTATTDASGVASLSPDYVITQGAGTYVIEASFDGSSDPSYSSTTDTADLTVTQEDATLTYTGDTVADGGPFTLQATVTQAADGSPGDITLAGTVEFRLYYKAGPDAGTLAGTYTAAVAADGTATVNLASLAARSYDVEVELLPGDYYVAPLITVVIQTVPVIAVDDASGQYSDGVTLRATMTADGGPVSGRDLDFSVDGVYVGTATTDASGVATLPYTIGLPAGSYAIDVSFAGDGTYQPASGSGTLTVTQEDATLTYTGDTVTTGGTLSLSASVTQAADGSPGDITLAGTVEFVVKDQTGATVDTQTAAVQADGTVSATSASLPNRAYTVEVRLVANGYYVAAPVTAQVKGTPALTVDPQAGQYSDSVTLTATLTDDNGGISGKDITFTVDGVVAGTATTDASGVASLPYLIELGAGTYTIQADFAGDAAYVAASDTNSLTVSHEDATLTYTGDTSLSSSGGSLSLSATVTQAADGSPGDITLAGTVRFTVKKVSDGTVVETVDAAVDVTGVASGATSVLPAEPYTIDVELLPGSYYAAPALTPAATVKVEPVLAVDAKAGQYSDAVALTATLSDAAGGVGGKDITFTVDGVVVGTATTDASGVATLSPDYVITQGAGTYVIEASFDGSSDPSYSSATDTADLTVTQEDATLTYTGDTVADGGPFTLQATVTQAADGSPGDITLAGTVEFRLYYKAGPDAGTLAGTYTAAVAADGTATVNLASLAARSYDVEVELLPGDYYVAPLITAVIQTVPVIAVDDASGQYSDGVTLRATMTADGGPVSGRDLDFSVDGVYVGTAMTDASGVATLPYTIGLPAGSYAIDVSFAGDGTYQPVSGSGTLTVTQEDATLTYTGDTVTTGGTLSLSASVTQAADGSPGDITLAGTVEFVVKDQTGATVDTQTAAVQADGTVSATSASLPNRAYTVEVRLVANGYYVAAPVTAQVKGTPALTVDPQAGQYSDSVTLTATLTDDNGGISGKDITFTVDGVVAGTATTDASGVASLPYLIELGAGTYTIQADFAGDAAYVAASDTNSLTVSHEDATLTYTGDTSLSSSGGSLSLSATVTQAADGSPGDITLAGTVRFTVKKVSDGTVVETVDAAVDVTGVASGATSVLPAEPYTIDVELLPGSYYAAPALTPAATVKVEPVLAVDAKAGQYSDAVALTATLSDAAGGVGGKDITFTVDGVVVGTATTDASGVATLSPDYVITQGAGTYVIEASFDGSSDPSYSSATDTADLTVTQEDATLTYTGDTVADGGPFTLQATVTQAADGSPGDITLAGTVQFDLYYQSDGTLAATYTAAVAADGTATVNLAGLAARAYDVVVTLQPNDYYTAAPTSAAIQTVPVLTVDDVSGEFGETVILRATLTEDTIPISGKTITFMVDGAPAGSSTTDASGVATVSYTIGLAAGTYTIQADFAGDSYYQAASGTGTLTVSPAATTLTVADVAGQYGETVTLSATLTRSDDGTPVLGKDITFAVNGTAVGTATTDASGVATLSYTIDVPAGTHTIGADFAGDAYYAASSGTGTLTVSKAPTTLVADDQTITYGQTVTLTATLTSGGTPVAGRTIDFMVDGVSVGSGTTDASGLATYTYTPSDSSGTYTIEASFAGDGYYLSSSDMATLTVNKAPTTLAADDQTITYGQSVTLTATLTSGGAPVAGRTIAFTVDGVSVGSGITDASGVARYTYTPGLAVGTYTIEAAFVGDGYYLASTDTATLTVNKAPTTLVADDQTITYGQSVTLTATLTSGGNPVKGRAISFAVNGLSVGSGTTDASGVASYTYTPTDPPGTYTIAASFAGDGYYRSSSDTAVLTINKLPTTLVVDDKTVEYGNVVNLTATLTRTDTGDPLAGRTVTLTVNGTPLTGTTDASGVVTIPFTAGISVGTYTITGDFAGDTYYQSATGTGTLTVTKGTPVIVADNSIDQYSDLTPFRATMTSSDGSPIVGKPVDFYLNSIYITSAVTDASGVAVATSPSQISGPAGTYTGAVEARFAGDADLNFASDTADWIRSQEDGTISGRWEKRGKGTKYRVFVSFTEVSDGSLGNIDNAQVRLQVDIQDAGTGQWSTCRVTNPVTPTGAPATTGELRIKCNQGLLSQIRILLLPNGYYTAPAVIIDVSGGNAGTFSVNDASGTSGRITTLSAGFSTTAVLQAEPVLLASLWTDTAPLVAGGQEHLIARKKGSRKGKGGKPPTPPGLVGQPVHFYVDGRFVGEAPIQEDGFAYLEYPIDLPAGTYTIEALFKGHATMGPARTEGTLTVTPQPATLSYTGDTAAGTAPFALRATLTPADGNLLDLALAGSVRFRILDADGQELTAVQAQVGSDGVAEAPLEALPDEAATIEVSLAENGYFVADTVTVPVTENDEAGETAEPES